MSLTFRIPLKFPRDALLEHVADTLPQHGLAFTHGRDGGSFSGRGFEGAVRFTETDMEIEVTRKPHIVGWTRVEETVMRFLVDQG